jgi:hypothetical protein
MVVPEMATGAVGMGLTRIPMVFALLDPGLAVTFGAGPGTCVQCGPGRNNQGGRDQAYQFFHLSSFSGIAA